MVQKPSSGGVPHRIRGTVRWGTPGSRAKKTKSQQKTPSPQIASPYFKRKSGQNGSKLGPKCYLSWLPLQHDTNMKKVPKAQYVLHFWHFRASILDRKSVIKRLKIAPKSIRKSLKFWIDFLIDF